MTSNLEPVVVVHGLWMPGMETLLLQRRLHDAGFSPRLFRYRSVSDNLDANAAALARFVDRTPGGPVHVVGHSLGGVFVDLKIVLLGDRQYRRHRGRVAVQVHRHDGARTRADCRFDRRGVEVESV